MKLTVEHFQNISGRCQHSLRGRYDWPGHLRRALIFLLLISAALNVPAATVDEVTQLVSDGHWQQAQKEISMQLAQPGLSFQTKWDLMYQLDRMNRLRLAFDRTRDQVYAEAQAKLPGINQAMFDRWDQAGALESLNIDGTLRYYHSAVYNLVRINPEAKALNIQWHPEAATQDVSYVLSDVRSVIKTYEQTGNTINSPISHRYTYTLTVKPDAVAPGETIRAWLPFPHALDRQSHIRLIATDPPQSISSTNAALSSVYLEKTAVSMRPTQFKIVFECTSAARYQPIDAARVQVIDTNDPALAPFLTEAPPNILYTAEVRKLAQSIVGTETNAYRKARLLFAWVGEHIPWTLAREYSTIPSLSQYAFVNHHGDCGIEATAFMTLCRLNGIPARWESGWITRPNDMHDWCEIYLAPYGWIPADPCYGLVDSPDEKEKWFYLGGIDNTRLVLNTDFCQPNYPAKVFLRSEIVDFQRGEVEWRGGNLYFDQWTWDFQAEEIPGTH